jgi:hypothetical protein
VPPRPEQTTLYHLVQQHAASFIAQTEASTGAHRAQRDELALEQCLGHQVQGSFARPVRISTSAEPTQANFPKKHKLSYTAQVTASKSGTACGRIRSSCI